MLLTFATWNLWDFGMQAHHPDQEVLVQQAIRDAEPDVLAVQEICGAGRGPEVLRRLAAAVGMECVVPSASDDADGEVAIAHASGDPGSRFHVGLMWRPSLLTEPMVDRPGDGEFWHNLITVTGLVDNRMLRFASFHGRPFGLHARADECERVVSAIARTYHGAPPPALIGADWNATSGDIVPAGDGTWRYHQRDPFTGARGWDPAWLYQVRTKMHLGGGEITWHVDREAGARLRDGELQDVAALLNVPEQPTCGFGPAADMPPRTIDQIRANRPMWPALRRHQVIGGSTVEAASDHRMVLAVIDTEALEVAA